MKRTATQGFTLLELLTVIAIIAILGSTLFWFSRPYLIRQQVGEAASQLSQDIERLRSTAAKTSRTATITFDKTKPTTYRLSYWGGSQVVNQDVVLPNGVTVDFSGVTTSTLTVTYTAPYAEVAAVNRTLTLNPRGYNSASGANNLSQNVYIVGVTGKVH